MKDEVNFLYNKYELPLEKAQFMKDGTRRIDYMLMYKEEEDPTAPKNENDKKKHKAHHHRRRHSIHPSKGPIENEEEEERKKRQFFEENLTKEGLQLEYDRHRERHDKRSKNESTKVVVFIKVHVPWPVLCKWAETLKIKMPLRLVDKFDLTRVDKSSIGQKTGGQFGWTRAASAMVAPGEKEKNDQLDPDDSPITGHPNFVTMPFQKKRIDKFAISDPDTFFSTTQRQEIVYEIFQRCKNDPEDDKKRGIEALLEEKIYEGAFPLHDGDFVISKNQPMTEWCNRQRLAHVWGSWTAFFKRQPYELIRSYFGEKVAFYFAFLGFYTKWLLFPTFTGLIVFIYGIFYTGDDQIVDDLCHDEHGKLGSQWACPICHFPKCEFEKLADGCVITQWDFRMDNEATPVLAVLTVIWATVFLKAWKRREAELAYNWDTYDLEFEDDVVRPEYEERAPARHRNFVTREIEPYVPRKTRYWWIFLSSLVTFFMLLLVTVGVVLLVLARIGLYGLLCQAKVAKCVEVARILIHIVLIGVVMLFDKIYGWMAEKLTSFECPRTQSQWITSFLWKVFIFELVNDFIPIAYAAWIKGRIALPHNLDFFTEMCEPGGCMSEVTEVITFLLLGRLVVGNTMEIGIPLLQSMWHRSRSEKQKSQSDEEGEPASKGHHEHRGQWHHDALAEPLELDGVAEEYLEMMVQFAFVTLFVPSLPLAPLVCLINNFLEIRVDAIKFVIHQRPLPRRSPGVQIWNNFLDIIAKIAVLSNAGLIAFTSDTLPRLYYKYAKKAGESYDGFQDFTLSRIDAEYFKTMLEEKSDHHGLEELEHMMHTNNFTHCYYNDYREEHTPFDHTQDWWETWTIRFAFFGVFLVFSFSFQFLYNFIVPDVPTKVRMQIQRRRYVLSKGLEQAAANDSSEKWLKQAIYGKTPNAVAEQQKMKKDQEDEEAINEKNTGFQPMVVEDVK